jgi:anti-sigma regulatory factor (Ser/Thr protein kinase)
VLDHAHAASSAASEMLTTLLDFSRLEAGVVKSQPKPFLLQPLLAQLEQEFGLQADAGELVYRTRETSLAVLADPNLTDLVLRNFISNAIRYTDKGGVLVGCRQRGNAVVVEVWDTGMGIADDHHDEVFKEFHQLGNPERDRRKGLGLGLAIVERISAAMDAKVTLRSVPGRGSVFRLWLEGHAGHIANELDTQPHSKNLRGMRVLVIDDEEPVRMGMQELLGSLLGRCRIVSTAMRGAAADGPTTRGDLGRLPPARGRNRRPSHQRVARLPHDARAPRRAACHHHHGRHCARAHTRSTQHRRDATA